jgi:hypothetical protein
MISFKSETNNRREEGGRIMTTPKKRLPPPPEISPTIGRKADRNGRSFARAHKHTDKH